MTVKTTRRRGLQARGKTQIDGNFIISKNDTEVSISSGQFIETDGTVHDISGTVKDIGTSKEDREIGIWLTVKGVVISEDRPKDVIQVFVHPDWFVVPANTSDLSTVDMYAYGWIDKNPKNISGNPEYRHQDIQELKKNGAEIADAEVSEKLQIPKTTKKTRNAQRVDNS